MLPTKVISLSGFPVMLFGISEDDPYFQSITDDLDPEFVRLAEANVADDAVCVDIGANIGVKALQLAHIAANGRVVAIEAAPRVYECLEAALTVNGLPNLVAEHAAITDHDGIVRFEDNSAYGHISPTGIEVRSATLSSTLHRHGLARLDFVKIDVEGFEFPILRASLPVFEQHGTVVCFEFNTWCMAAFTNEHPRLCLEWLLTSFAEVYALRRGTPPRLECVKRDGALGLLATNMLHDGHVSDLVVCTKPGRIRF